MSYNFFCLQTHICREQCYWLFIMLFVFDEHPFNKYCCLASAVPDRNTASHLHFFIHFIVPPGYLNSFPAHVSTFQSLSKARLASSFHVASTHLPRLSG